MTIGKEQFLHFETSYLSEQQEIVFHLTVEPMNKVILR